MRFMMFMLPNLDVEHPGVPSAEDVAEMTKYNEELVKAGVMLEGEGLHPQSEGVRVAYSGGKRTIIDGPYTEAKEAIGGYWIIQTKSKEEAIEWAKRVPAIRGADFTIELRQIFELEEFEAYVQDAAK